MALRLAYTLFCLTAVLLFGSSVLTNEEDAVRVLLGNLEKFKPMVSGNLEKVVDVMKHHRQAGQATPLESNTEHATSLQTKLGKVGKLLNVVADRKGQY